MNPFSAQLHYKLIFIAFSFLCLFSYPALYLDNTYEIAFPSLFFFNGLCLLPIFCGKLQFIKNKRLIIIGLTLYFIPLLYGIFFQNIPLHNTIIFAGYLTTPLTIALLLQNINKNKLAKLLTSILALTWLVNTLTYLFTTIPFGLSGNPNWFSQLSLCTSIFALLYTKNKITINQLRWAIYFIISALTLYLIYISHSRAVILSILAFCYLKLLLTLSTKKRFFLLLITTLLITFSYFNWQSHWQKIYHQDIRGPLYKSVMTMITDTPKQILLGVGAGNFRKDFVNYRSQEHRERGVSSSITYHPHNELLLLASSLGIIAAFIWLLIILKVLFIQQKDKFYLACHFSLTTIFVQSLLDKVITMPPTNLIFAVLLGTLLCLPLSKYLKLDWNIINEKKQFLKIFCSLFLLFYLIYTSVHFTMSDSYYRQANRIPITNIKQITQARKLYILSTETNPYKIKSYLSAISLDLFNLYPLVSKAQQKQILSYTEKELQLATKLGLNYAHINKLWGKFYQEKYHHNPSAIYKEKSLVQYKKYSELFSDRGDARFQYFNALIEFDNTQQALDFYPQVLASYNNKFINRFDYPLQKLQKFSTDIFNPKIYQQNLKLLQEILRRVVEGTKDLNFKKTIPTTSPLSPILNQPLANELDNYYWYQYLSLHQQISSQSLQQIIQNSFSKIKLDNQNLSYTPPLNYYKKPTTSPISIASFLAFAGTIKGYQTYITQTKKTYCVIFINSQENFKLDFQTKKIIQLFNPIILDKNTEIIINTFPQEFTMTTIVMHYLLTKNLNLEYTDLLPTIRFINAKKIFSNNKISFLPHTTNYFAKKLKN